MTVHWGGVEGSDVSTGEREEAGSSKVRIQVYGGLVINIYTYIYTYFTHSF